MPNSSIAAEPRSTEKRRRVLLGEITGVHGIRGEVVLRTYTADPFDIGAYGPLASEAGDASFEIRVLRAGARGVVAAVKGVTDRNAAERLRGTKLFVDRARLPSAAEGEYYHADLIGLTARTAGGEVVGRVVAVPNYGAGDLVEIRLKDGKRTELLPFVEDYILAVDLGAGTMTIAMPEYVIAREEQAEAGEDGAALSDRPFADRERET
jgi:16S rRNA processing protein RimM